MRAITLDTNAYTAFMSGRREVLDELARAERIFIPIFVVAELHFGFRGGTRFEGNVAELEKFLEKSTVHEWLPTRETADIYGETQDQLKRAGTPNPGQ